MHKIIIALETEDWLDQTRRKRARERRDAKINVKRK